MKDNLITNICDYIDKHIKEDIRIEDLSNTFYFDRYYLMRLFKKETGKTIIDYINSKRIINSMPPLIYTNDKILKIALESGFNSSEYYTEQFNKVVGISPINFRKLSNIYDMSSFVLGGNDMDNNKLDSIRKSIAELNQLREQLVLLVKDNEQQMAPKSAPKVYSLIPRVDKKNVA